MGKLMNKFAHVFGLYTADDVEHIEKHWRERLDKVTTAGIKLVAGGGAGGGGVDMRGAGGKGGHGHGYVPLGTGWYGCDRYGNVISSSRVIAGGTCPTPTKPSHNPTAPTGQRMSAAERRELAAEAVRWCEQQRIEASPENIIFYLDDRRIISAPTPGTADL